MSVLDPTCLSDTAQIDMIQSKKMNNNLLTIPHGKRQMNMMA